MLCKLEALYRYIFMSLNTIDSTENCNVSTHDAHLISSVIKNKIRYAIEYTYPFHDFMRKVKWASGRPLLNDT